MKMKILFTSCCVILMNDQVRTKNYCSGFNCGKRSDKLFDMGSCHLLIWLIAIITSISNWLQSFSHISNTANDKLIFFSKAQSIKGSSGFSSSSFWIWLDFPIPILNSGINLYMIIYKIGQVSFFLESTKKHDRAW